MRRRKTFSNFSKGMEWQNLKRLCLGENNILKKSVKIKKIFLLNYYFHYESIANCNSDIYRLLLNLKALLLSYIALQIFLYMLLIIANVFVLLLPSLITPIFLFFLIFLNQSFFLLSQLNSWNLKNNNERYLI